MKKIFFALLVVSIVLFGCAGEEVTTSDSQQPAQSAQPAQSEQQETGSCPDCDDNDDCTADVCSASTDYKCEYRTVTPCCGNDECEEGEDATSCSADCETVMSEEVTELINGMDKIKSYKYSKWQDPLAKFVSVKGDKRRLELLDEKMYQKEYDTAIIDTQAKTAFLFCADVSCEERNIPEEFPYTDFAIETPLEIIEGATYGGEVVGTERCDNSYPCSKIAVTFDDKTKGFVWLGDYYGFPYKIEKGGKLMEYQEVAINVVKDTDVELP